MSLKQPHRAILQFILAKDMFREFKRVSEEEWFMINQFIDEIKLSYTIQLKDFNIHLIAK